MGGADQRLIKCRAEILLSDHRVKSRIGEDFQRLTMDAAEDDSSVLGLHPLDNAFQDIQAGGIHGGHQIQSEDQDLGELIHFRHGILHFFRSAEKQRAEHPVHDDSLGYFFALCHMLGPLQHVDLGHPPDLRGLRNPLDEKNGRQNHSNLDRDNDVEKHCQSECREQHERVAARLIMVPPTLLPFPHTHGDRNHDGRHGTHRDECGPFCRNQDDSQQNEHMNDARQRGPGPAIDVR